MQVNYLAYAVATAYTGNVGTSLFYPASFVPEVLTSGVDVSADRIELKVKSWGFDPGSIERDFALKELQSVFKSRQERFAREFLEDCGYEYLF